MGQSALLLYLFTCPKFWHFGNELNPRFSPSWPHFSQRMVYLYLLVDLQALHVMEIYFHYPLSELLVLQFIHNYAQ